MPAVSDREIIERFNEPTQTEIAFKFLVEKYRERLYWHCRRLVINHDDADDVLQNTFIKVWKNLDKFRSQSGLYTWLFRIATNESLSLIKKNKRRLTNTEDVDFETRMSDNLISDPYFDGDDANIKLQKAILNLPEKQRLVFNLKYYDELKYEEISEILKTSVGGLKASYHHAVKKIEKYLSEE